MDGLEPVPPLHHGTAWTRWSADTSASVAQRRRALQEGAAGAGAQGAEALAGHLHPVVAPREDGRLRITIYDVRSGRPVYQVPPEQMVQAIEKALQRLQED